MAVLPTPKRMHMFYLIPEKRWALGPPQLAARGLSRPGSETGTPGGAQWTPWANRADVWKPRVCRIKHQERESLSPVEGPLENSAEALAGVAQCAEHRPLTQKDSGWRAQSLAGGVQEAADRRVSFT